MMNFPSDFLWGAASAGHQNEGGDTVSDTAFLETVEETIFVEPAGAACRSYELWETDLDLVAGMGLNAYRFSVEWARIEPQPGVIDEAALDHYEAMVDGARARGIAPIITLSHFSAPQWFAARGAWLAEDAPELFAAHCARVIGRFGDRVEAVVTLNEPNLEQMLAFVLPPEAQAGKRRMLASAGVTLGVERYRSANVVLPEEIAEFEAAFTRVHRAAKRAIKEIRPELPVGVSIAISDEYALPGGEADRDAKRAAVYDHWLEVAAEDDFIGVQNYERIVHGPEGVVPPAADAEINGMGTAIAPTSLAGAVRYAHARSGVPVLVTEHGIQTADDRQRAEFIPASLALLEEVLAEGVPVLGYCHWTLLDNFEWIFGYRPKLGLHSVDPVTFERIAKPSAGAYAEVVAAHREAGALSSPGPRMPAM
ncbi:glycoside hydrolase family 1 protein [Brevibacterium oceani]|uniref:glycoside hydrolase family 1 protein n=1 Tax=Brevibacterium oceani TaxID=358099 RepID=UPI0015E6AF21|nr:family 1 glycosylhydrolase [Brevibacterium oceani]